MSNPIGRVDLTNYSRDAGEIKIGELTLNDDNILEGFLFENQVIRTLITDKPGSCSFGLVLYLPDRENPDGGYVHPNSH